MPLQATSGAASYDGFGGGVPFTPTYIEEIFSTTLYTGNGANRSINNGIDLSTKGGLVWIKDRTAVASNALYDTARGANNLLISNNTNAQNAQTDALTAFNTNGFSLGVDGSTLVNASGDNFVSWTFREQPKFFDVVTWTGDGTSGRSLPHSLGSVPGCVIIKRTSNTSDWLVWHRSLSGTYPSSVNYLRLNLTSAQDTASQPFTQAPSSTDLTLSASVSANGNGSTYVAYLFAHNAGGFGLTGTDNVISCGSFATPSGSATSINLGYEPQWLLVKAISTTDDWLVADNMRGFQGGSPTGSGNPVILRPNTSGTEGSVGQFLYLEPTGFNVQPGVYSVGTQFIYIAIRRGPMKTPTTGTSVYNAIARTGTSATATVTGVGFPPDLAVIKDRSGTTGANWLDRLRGPNLSIRSNNTADEVAAPDVLSSYDQNGVTLGSDTNGVLGTNTSGNAMINWFFRRAPGFFDEVCYTGDGVNGRAVPHNLTVAPELIIAKRRNATAVWLVYQSSLGTGQYLLLNSGGTPSSDVNMWGNTTPTSSNFYVGSSTNFSGGFNYVAYLFASCPGVSKVGNYTGNGTSQTINCGFTGGARWVMIKRTDSSGDWYVWDSTRGIVAGNDPRIAIGVGAAEDTSNDSIDTNSTGFIVNQDASNINVGSATYIYLAIA